MRIRLAFKIEQFPRAYRLGVLSVLKEAIKISSNDYYTQTFLDNRREMKPFVFSTYFPGMVIENDRIVANELHVTVSSMDYAFILHLYNGTQQQKRYQYQEYHLELIRVYLLKEQNIQRSKMVFKIDSPLLIEDKDGKPVAPDSPAFERELNYASQNAVQAYLNRPLHQPLHIRNANLQKQVIQEFFHQSNGKPLFFTAYKGFIELEGHPEDLQCLYDCGLGFRTQLGFGFLSTLNG